jgi:hypothetical protein
MPLGSGISPALLSAGVDDVDDVDKYLKRTMTAYPQIAQIPPDQQW